MFIFPVQLTTSRIGNLTRLIHTLLYVMTIHTYCVLCNAQGCRLADHTHDAQIALRGYDLDVFAIFFRSQLNGDIQYNNSNDTTNVCKK